MVWIESHQEIGRHPKTKRLARALGVGVPATVGHLHLLWHWAMAFAQDGDLAPFESWEIAEGALWEGDAGHFVEALQAAGFLEIDLSLHHWHEYAGKLIERRRSDAERKRALRKPETPELPGISIARQSTMAGVPDMAGGGRDTDQVVPAMSAATTAPDIRRTGGGRRADGGETADVTLPYPTAPDSTGEAPPVGPPFGAVAPAMTTSNAPVDSQASILDRRDSETRNRSFVPSPTAVGEGWPEARVRASPAPTPGPAMVEGGRDRAGDGNRNAGNEPPSPSAARGNATPSPSPTAVGEGRGGCGADVIRGGPATNNDDRDIPGCDRDIGPITARSLSTPSPVPSPTAVGEGVARRPGVRAPRSPAIAIADRDTAEDTDGRGRSSAGNRRPRRIGEDFQPSAAMQAWAEQELELDAGLIARETSKFRDHFAGSGKPKLDWEATWRNWMRTVAEGTYGPPGGRGSVRDTAQDGRDTPQRGRDSGRDGGPVMAGGARYSPALPAARGSPISADAIAAEIERRRLERDVGIEAAGVNGVFAPAAASSAPLPALAVSGPLAVMAGTPTGSMSAVSAVSGTADVMSRTPISMAGTMAGTPIAADAKGAGSQFVAAPDTVSAAQAPARSVRTRVEAGNGGESDDRVASQSSGRRDPGSWPKAKNGLTS